MILPHIQWLLHQYNQDDPVDTDQYAIVHPEDLTVAYYSTYTSDRHYLQ